MRYHVKGGIWKNTEDEILKAAVMKYGLNQWSRISSLLVRKSAKQCKERWYEWLDPQIKKTEWTKDEEEKLLHLAKMFPCQWRTIAPIVGRTAFQCMEQYEKLLDRAQGREADENDPRRLRPGEIDPNPETKPARPDPIDMEEDQKEMLNEARARLANTRGKKAKRKAREKQLEEARRLAGLQKKRELKSAGIEVVLRLPRKKKKEMNYNADVPFMRRVPEGSYNISKESTPHINKFKGAISLQFLENRTRDEDEEKFRKIDNKRMKNLKQKDLPEAIDKINKMNDPLNIIQRNKLILPEPQVNDSQLEGISKLTNTDMMIDSDNLNSNATNVLIGEYTNTIARGNLLGNTPLLGKTPKQDDTLMKEARLALSLQQTTTPLIGGVDAQADLENFVNYKRTEAIRNTMNRENQFKTPTMHNMNLNQSLIRTTQNMTNNISEDYPNSRNTKLTESYGTPFRDEMRINKSEDGFNAWESHSVTLSKNKEDSIFNKPQFSVKSILNNLPKPQNKYEIDFSDNRDNLIKEIEAEELKEKKTEDSEIRNIRLEKDKIQKEQIEFLNQTQVVQRNLPRPFEINYNYKSYSEIKLSLNEEIEEDTKNIKIMAEEYIKNEMLKLVEYDTINHPIKGNKIPTNPNFENEIEQFTLEEKSFAQNLIKEEMRNLDDINLENKEFYNVNNLKEFSSIWNHTNNKEVFYIPDIQMYFHSDDIEKAKKFDAIKQYFELQAGMLTKDENVSKKLEERANVLTGGYIKRFNILRKKYDDLNNSISDLKTKNKIYESLKEQEDFAILKRKRFYEDSIEKMKNRERGLQDQFKRLKDKIEELENL